jgi:hypothetical protein
LCSSIVRQVGGRVWNAISKEIVDGFTEVGGVPSEPIPGDKVAEEAVVFDQGLDVV